MIDKEASGRHLIKGLSDKRLMEQWELTIDQENSPVLAMVRGWLMDEIQKRFPRGFDRWISSGAVYDSDLKFHVEGEMSKRGRT